MKSSKTTKSIEGGLTHSGRRQISNLSPFIGAWGKVRQPDVTNLINEYKRVVFACANINANAAAQVPIKLFVRTRKNESSKNIKFATKRLTEKEILKLKGFNYKGKRIEVIDEVIDHPALQILEKVNDFNAFYKNKLFVLTHNYLDTIGKAYWLIDNDNPFNIVQNIWFLPSYRVIPVKRQKSNNIVDFYEFVTETGVERYSPDKIIPFLRTDLVDPYLGGKSPAQAAWEDILVDNRLIAHETNLLENEARPDALVSPGKDNEFLSDEIERIRFLLKKQFSKGETGKWAILPDNVDVKILNWSPRDIGRLEISKRAKVAIANAFDVPLSMLESESVNRATLEGGLTQHARLAIRPRCEIVVGVLNVSFLPLFDKSNRLFFAFDDPVPEDRLTKLAENVQLKNCGAISANDVREAYGLPPVEGGDELQAINVSNDLRQQQRDSGQSQR